MAAQKRIAVIWDWDFTLVNSLEQGYHITLAAVTQETKKDQSCFPALKDSKTYQKHLWSHADWRDFQQKTLGLTKEQQEKIGKNWSKYKIASTVKPKLFQQLKQTIRNLHQMGIQQFIVSDSDNSQITSVLEQQGLEECFSEIIGYDKATSMGLPHKPSGDIFIKLFEDLNRPDIIFSIGDTLGDVVSANALKAYIKKNNINSNLVIIWTTYALTPERIRFFKDLGITMSYTADKPGQLLKIIRQEIGQSKGLKTIPKNLKGPLPSREECFQFWDEFKMPDNIRRHSLQVDKIAVFLAKKLKEKGISLDEELVDRAALLHDLDKILTKNTNNHGELTNKILKEKGYPQVGELVALHRFHHIHDKNLTWEAKILLYADKRVKHDKITSVAERLHDLIVRYKLNDENIDKEADEHFHRLEGELFSLLGIDSEKLGEYLE